MANQTLEEKMLSFSLLREGEDEDKREEHLVEEKRRQIEDEAGDEDDLPGMTKAEYHEMLSEAGESYAQARSALARTSIKFEQNRRNDSMRSAAEAQRKANDPLAERTTGRRTGPKGVIADKKWHDFLQTKQADREAAASRDKLRRMAGGVDAAALAGGGNPHSISVGATWSGSGPGFESAAEAARKAHGSRDGAEAEAEAEAEAGEDDFLAAYRAQRLRQLQGKGTSTSSARALDAGPTSDDEDEDAGSGSASFRSRHAGAAFASPAEDALPSFGEVLRVDGQEAFAAAVDAVPSPCFAVVLMWEPFLPAAAALHTHVWPALAAAHTHVAFLSAVSSALSESIDVVGLPAVVLYRGGRTVEALVAVQAELQGLGGLTLEGVTALLRRHGVAPLAPIAREQGRRAGERAGAAGTAAGSSSDGSAWHMLGSEGGRERH